MKFTHQLKFNAVPEWKEYYINYPLLKKIIYATRAAECQDAYDGVPPGGADEESPTAAPGPPALRSPRTSASGSGLRAPLLSASGSLGRSASVSVRSGDSEFIKALDQELARIISFYLRKEGELTSAFESLSLALHSRDGCEAHIGGVGAAAAAAEAGSGDAAGGAGAAAAGGGGAGGDVGKAAPSAPAAAPPGGGGATTAAQRADFARRVAYWASGDRAVAAERERLRQKLVALFVQLDGLKKYLEMNHTGFRKILKKHDKETTQVGAEAAGRPLRRRAATAAAFLCGGAARARSGVPDPSPPPLHTTTAAPIQGLLHGNRRRQAAPAQRGGPQPAHRGVEGNVRRRVLQGARAARARAAEREGRPPPLDRRAAAELARALGPAHAISLNREPLVRPTREMTSGRCSCQESRVNQAARSRPTPL
jgi:hypothetical protein